jgi:parallel beta-helix repeat protein
MPKAESTTMRTLWISGRQTNRAIRRPQRRRRQPLVEDLEGRQLLSNFYVSSTSDSTNPNETGSLWEAIYDSNNAPGSTPNTIYFQLSGSGPWTIELKTAQSTLPAITQPVILDGFTQSGTTAPTPGIELDGENVVGVGLNLSSSGSTIQGLAIVNFTSDGVQINSASDNLITDNYIGVTNSSGHDGSNKGNGVTITGGSSGNTIGGTVSGAGNTISDNLGNGTVITGNGVYITGGSSDNLVEGNQIGTDASGDHPATNPNAENGVLIDDGSLGNTIGGTVSGAGNTISDNAANGIEINGSNEITNTPADSSGNLVAGNHIGTTADGNGTDAGNLANQSDGVYITAGSTGNTIGATSSGGSDVISDNQFDGVDIDDGSSENTVEGNFIGTNANGTKALQNTGDGVLITYGAPGSGNPGASANIIGGTVAGAGNVISGNHDDGVEIDHANDNTVLGNLIGTELNSANPLKGTAALPNVGNGILVHGDAGYNTIGGTASGAGNTISGNDRSGVEIASGASNNLFEGDWIGTKTNGTAALGNVLNGVVITGGSKTTSNIIGGTVSGAGNVISGNKQQGVYLEDSSSGTLLEGNWIGTNFGGTAVVANLWDGVLVDDVSGTTIGGTETGAGNTIAGNGDYGVHINGNSTGSLLEGNFIGTNSAGSSKLSNGWDGVYIDGSSGNTIGGTTSGARNTISHNDWDGIAIWSTSGDEEGNLVWGNVINSNGSGAKQNDERAGVYIAGTGASNNTIGGTATGAANTISHNTYYGIYLNKTGVDTNNDSLGNFIEDDVIDHNGHDGIYASNAPSTTIMDCTIEYNTDWGIYGSGTTINSTVSGTTPKHNGNNKIQL